MFITEIQSFLTKAAGVVSDAPVLLRSIEGDVETEIKAISVAWSTSDDGAAPAVTLVHGPVTPTPTTPEAANGAAPSNPVSEAPSA